MHLQARSTHTRARTYNHTCNHNYITLDIFKYIASIIIYSIFYLAGNTNLIPVHVLLTSVPKSSQYSTLPVNNRDIAAGTMRHSPYASLAQCQQTSLPVCQQKLVPVLNRLLVPHQFSMSPDSCDIGNSYETGQLQPDCPQVTFVQPPVAP